MTTNDAILAKMMILVETTDMPNKKERVGRREEEEENSNLQFQLK